MQNENDTVLFRDYTSKKSRMSREVKDFSLGMTLLVLVLFGAIMLVAVMFGYSHYPAN